MTSSPPTITDISDSAARLAGAIENTPCLESRTLLRICGLTFIHPFDDPAVIAGQATMTVEIIDQVADLDALVVPIGAAV